jgi:hypothetical protein
MENKAMTLEQLEQVAGGHQQEIAVLMDAFGMSYGLTMVDFSQTAAEIKKRLKDEFGIDAVLFGCHNKHAQGLYIGHADEKNTYKDIQTGRSMTHKEVMTLIRKIYPHK